METELVCFPEPLNACFPLSYGARPQPGSEAEDPLTAESPLPALDELFGEDWD